MAIPSITYTYGILYELERHFKEENMKPPIKDLQYAIAETIASKESAYDIVEMCKYFGLPVKDDDNPWSSKRIYVLSLIKKESESFLIDLATKVYERYQSDRLKIVSNDRINGGFLTDKMAQNLPQPA